VLQRPQLELHGGVPRFDDRVIKSGPGTAHGLGDGKPLAGLPEAPAVYSAAPIGVQDDAGHGAAARCHGHRQRPVGVAGVVMLAQRESQHAAGGRVHRRGDSVNLNCRNYPFLTCRTSTIGSRVAVGREPIWCGVAPRPWRHAGKQTHRLGCGRARDASLSRRVAAGVRRIGRLRRPAARIARSARRTRRSPQCSARPYRPRPRSLRRVPRERGQRRGRGRPDVTRSPGRSRRSQTRPAPRRDTVHRRQRR